MKHYRILTIEFDNRQELRSLILKLKQLNVTNWKINNLLSKKYAESNGLNKEEVVCFISPPLKYLKPKADQEVFAGAVYLGIKDNSLKVFDIISVIKGVKLAVHLYNLIIQNFINEIIKPNKDLFGKTLGNIKLEKIKPSIPSNKNKKETKLSIVIAADPKSFKVFNARLNRPIHYISKDNSVEVLMQEGDEVKIGNKSVSYFKPNNIAILLSLSNKSLTEAERLLTTIKSLGNAEDALNGIKNRSEIICDFIEQVQSCIVFTYTAIEAFVNLSIPENYEYYEIKKEAGVHYEKKYFGNSVERLLPLKTKIKEILPDIYETNPIENEKFYSHFDQLEQLRNKIIHQKSIEHTELYNEYFKDGIFKICNVANELVSFFYENCEGDFTTNPIWPFISGRENNFPKSYYNSGDFDVVASIHDPV